MIRALVAAAAGGREPIAPPATLTLAEQQADLDQLRELLVANHPGLGLVADAAEVDAAFARARSELVDGDTPLGFLRSAMLPVAAMHCSHTVLEPKGGDELALYAAGGWFPFDLWPDGDRLWLDPRGVHGAVRELLAVDGRPVSELVPELRARIESDDGRPAGQDVWLDLEPWFAMTVLVGPRETWTLRLRTLDGEVVEKAVPGVDPAEVRTERHLTRPRTGPSRVAPGVVLFPMPELADSPRESRKVVAALREAAADQDALVLDLRGNGGGRTLSLLDVVALFVDHPVDPYRFGTTRVPWRDWPLGADGRTHGDAGAVYGGVAPLGDPPAAKLVVLVDEQTASSASDLAFLLRREAGAVVVGRETGGAAWAQTAETKSYFRLRNSGLWLELPLVTIVMGPDELRGRGVVPDHEARPSVLDLALGRDPALACAIAVARGMPCPSEPGPVPPDAGPPEP